MRGVFVSIPFRADTGFELDLAFNAGSPQEPFQSLSGLTLGLNHAVDFANLNGDMSFNPFQG